MSRWSMTIYTSQTNLKWHGWWKRKKKKELNPQSLYFFLLLHWFKKIKKTTGPQAQNGITFARSCHQLGLNTSSKWSFNHPKKCSLNWSIRNFPVYTNEVICHMGPFHHAKGRWSNSPIETTLSPKWGDLIWNNLFCLFMTYQSYP